MATESDPAVTRVTVILNTPDDWFNWSFIRRDVANRHGLWQYINPDVAKELLPEPTEATEPQLIDYKAVSISFHDPSYARYCVLVANLLVFHRVSSTVGPCETVVTRTPFVWPLTICSL
jgi:hypothetical protein